MCEYVACLYSPQMSVFVESQLTSNMMIASEVIPGLPQKRSLCSWLNLMRV